MCACVSSHLFGRLSTFRCLTPFGVVSYIFSKHVMGTTAYPPVTQEGGTATFSSLYWYVVSHLPAVRAFTYVYHERCSTVLFPRQQCCAEVWYSRAFQLELMTLLLAGCRGYTTRPLGRGWYSEAFCRLTIRGLGREKCTGDVNTVCVQYFVNEIVDF